MLTRFGRFCRKLRIDNGKLLFDMAEQLGVSSAFLSKVENGKAKPQMGWLDIIVKEYNLDDHAASELEDCIKEARTKSVINVSELSGDDRDMMLAFARKLDTMSQSEKEKFRKMLGY